MRRTERLTARQRDLLKKAAADDPRLDMEIRPDDLLSLLDDAAELDARPPDDPAADGTDAAHPAVSVEHWEGDEYVITVGGSGVVGGTLHKREAEQVAAWLRTAVREIRNGKA